MGVKAEILLPSDDSTEQLKRRSLEIEFSSAGSLSKGLVWVVIALMMTVLA